MSVISSTKNIIAFLLVGVLSLLLGWSIALYGIDFRTFLFFILLIGAVVIIAMGKKALNFGFITWIWMFVLGYRTIHLTPDFSLHPLILFLVLLFLILLSALRSEPKIHLKLPFILWGFSLFWVWGFIPGVLNGLPWLQMISDASNFFFLIPLFWIILYLSRSSGFWKSVTLTFLGSGVLISLLGSLEYFFPQVLGFLPGLAAGPGGFVAQTGFFRATYAFFGANPAVLICALALPMVGLVPRFYKTKLAILFSFVMLGILGIGIYISGTRTAWLMVLFASLLLAYFSFKIIGAGVVSLFWVVASRFFPTQVWSLILSVYTPAVSGQFLDSSMEKRFNRQQDAFNLAVQNPFGVGWSGSGWVHGDFTQVAANLGLFAGAVFLIWYLTTLYRAWKVYIKYPKDWIFQSILTSFILAGLVLATEGVQVLPQFAMPVWFVWGLMEAYLQQKNSVIASS